MQTKQKYVFSLIGLMVAALVLFGVAGLWSRPPAVEAATQSQILAEIADVEAQIQRNEAQLHELEGQSQTLENKISSLKLEISSANQRIDVTNKKINQLELKIEETEAELARQEAILADALRELYKRGDVTTIELLASSDSYSEFINQQEYLSRMKTAIQESANKVQQLKDELDSEKAKQEDYLAQVEGQRRVLQNKKDEQARLLEQTRGQEARYQNIVTDLKQQREAAEVALQQFIARGQFVNLGPISEGNTLGTVGNTGFSSGAHLHFEVRNSAGNVVDPKPFINNGWSWPTPGANWQIWQDYGVPSGLYVRGYHPGIDTGYAGQNVVAMASGTIIARGCSQDYLGTPAYGYMVMIDHGNGYKSLYAHMLPPASSAYNHCSYSYGF